MKNNLLTKIAAFIVEKRNLFFLLVVLGFIFSAFSVRWVEVENDLVYYLPSESETKIGMELMEENFTTLGTANVMVANITYEKALEYVEDISEVEGVQSVTFDHSSAHYQNASALYTISFAYDQYDAACEASLKDVKDVLKGEDIYIGSEIGYSLPDIIAKEVEVIMVYVAIIITLVLLLTSQTYAEIPVLLLTFVVAAVLNMGTNFIMGKISFVSNSVTTVLQLALSLDYAVIFCNRYKEEHKALPIKEATISALSKSIPEILASSMTTVGGLFAMLFMQFKIGPDMGINLIKSILFALLSVFLVMPGFLVLFGPLMDKTRHKNFIPEIPFVGKFAYATRFIIPPIFAVVLIIGCILAGNCPYVYGYNKLETAKLNEKKIAEHMIRDNFSSTEMVALVIPSGDYKAEGAILETLKEYEEVDSALGLAGVEALGGYMLSDSLNPREFAELADLDYELAQVVYAAYAVEQGSHEKIISSISTYEIPLIDIFLFVCDQIDAGIVSLGEEQLRMLEMAQVQMESAKMQLQSDAYSRMLIQVDIPEGGDTLYAFLDTIRETAQQYYPEQEVYVVGNPTSEYDFQKTFVKDNVVISVLTILIVLGVLLFTFKSVGMPLLLIMVIQGSIWINFSVPTITGDGIFFMTYLIVSAIQMGANIDYAIVIASRFAELKDKMPHKQAIVETMNFAFPTIAISGTIMATASFFIGNMTSEGSIANMGLNLARGTVISIILVMFVLPQLLLIGAKIIDKTSFSMPKVLSAVLLALALSGSMFVPAQAADIFENRTEIIQIYDADDWLEFAEKCALDVWSQNKEVFLEADISLDEIDYLPVPTFGGTFDGKGHSVSGLKIEESISPAGLFGVLQEGALVKNLNVSGTIEPGGDHSAVGGIVGENYGDIIHCTFTGSVVGEQRTGGIAGLNGINGQVKNCRMNGSVIGQNMVGGICGYNMGNIIKCKNNASVNTVHIEPSMSIQDLNLEVSADITNLKDSEQMGSVSDVGGIAGYSMGQIEGCSNSGTIGYPHVGYNMGGIAGRSCGYVGDSTNDGEIFGRKDVGGILGQMEPYIHVELSASSVALIKQDANTLSNAMEETEKDIGSGSAAMQKRMNRIERYLDDIEKTLASEEEEALDAAQTIKLKAAMDILEKELALFAKETAGSAGALQKDLQRITSSADALTHTFEGAMQEAENLALSDFVEDISEINLEDASYGKAAESINEGAVNGDINVGGIAGAVSLEYDIDPEDDLTEELSMNERRKYELSAIIYDCKNTAVISAKKNYAGGICGRLELGFLTDCEGYGTVYSQSGDYVGGIAGSTGSTIQNCFAKCSLAGRKYIGGIVGSGITEDATGESSTVRDCYSLVDIMGCQQFAGAIAGEYAGDYVNCYFVSDELQGINRISYEGSAEPISYNQLLDVEGLPKEFSYFTLVFMDGEEVVYATAFEYGESFDADIFPLLPKDKNINIQWDTTELKNLKKDTIVRTVASDYKTTLASEEVRSDKRAVFLAEGKFAEEDAMLAERITITFDTEGPNWLRKAEVLEQWNVALPEDGMLIHTLRYLPENPSEQDDLELYVKQDGKWKAVEKNTMGSYWVFHIAETEAELAVVEVVGLQWLWAAAAIVMIGLIGGVIWLVYKKKNILRWLVWILAALIAILLLLLAAVFLNKKFGSGIQAYQLLKSYVEQPEIAMQLQVEAQVGEEELNLEADVFCTEIEGHSITCLEQSGVSVFYADGKIISENSKAYQASEVSADYAELLTYAAALYQDVELETWKEDNSRTYRMTVKKDSREKLLSYLLPEYTGEEMDVSKMQMDVVETEKALDFISISAKGKLPDKERKDFVVTAVLRAADAEEVFIEIPEKVKTAVLSEEAEVQEIITEDIFRMYAGWKELYDRNPLGMEIYLHADCGPLELEEELTYISVLENNMRINCVQKNNFPVYFTEDKICSEKGYAVTAKRAETISTTELLGIAYELCMNGEFSCTKVEDDYIYSVVLEEAGMRQIAEDIAKESLDIPITFENGSVQVYMQDNKVRSIRFACDGTADILLTEVSVAFSAELDLTHPEKYVQFAVPEKVLKAFEK